MTGPTLLVFVFFVIFPVAVAAYYGFFSWQGYGPPTDFVGLRQLRAHLPGRHVPSMRCGTTP